MRAGTRSAAMLAGFLAVAWFQVVAALLIVLLVLDALPGTVAVQLAVPLAIATAGLLWWATVRALRLRRPAPAGVPVTRPDAPRLWAMLDEAAVAAGVAPPDGVTVVATAAVTLGERLRFGGLLGGRRDLYLGLPLLQAWDEARLRAAVAHELAHGSPALGGRFAPMARRGRVALGRIVPRIPARSPAGPLLRAWARWYRAVDDPYSREQELAADRVAASFAGARAAAAALRDGPVLDGMQQLFHAEYLSPGWQTGHVPDDVFGGFLRVLAARAEDAAILRAHEPEPPGEWDPHPPLAERLAALAALPPPAGAAANGTDVGAATDGTGAGAATDGTDSGAATDGTGAGVDGAIGADAGADPLAASDSVASSSAVEAGPEAAVPAGSLIGRAADRPAAGEVPSPPAGDLVPDLPGLGRALQAVAFPVGGRTVVGWDEFFGVARLAEMEREADASLRALSRVAGSPVTGPAELLDLAADGRLRKLAETLFDDLPADEVAGRVTDLIALLLALAALHGGVARWRHSWSGTAELVAIDGSHLDLVGPAELAGDPATVGEARERLAALGLDLSAATGAAHRPAVRVPVLGGVVNVLVDGARTDLLVVETGFVLMPALPRSRHAEAKRRLTRLATDGVLADGSPAVPEPTGATAVPEPTGATAVPEPTGATAVPQPMDAAALPRQAGAAAGSRPAAEAAGSGPVGEASVARQTGGAGGSGPAGEVSDLRPADAASVLQPAGGASSYPTSGEAAPAGEASSTGRQPGPAATSPGPATGATTAAEATTATTGTTTAATTTTATGTTATGTLSPTPAGHGRSRFVPFAEVATASSTRSGRRGWEISLRDGGALHVRTGLDSEELPGGWAALDDAVAFLARTR